MRCCRCRLGFEILRHVWYRSHASRESNSSRSVFCLRDHCCPLCERRGSCSPAPAPLSFRIAETCWGFTPFVFPRRSESRVEGASGSASRRLSPYEERRGRPTLVASWERDSLPECLIPDLSAISALQVCRAEDGKVSLRLQQPVRDPPPPPFPLPLSPLHPLPPP